jgi:hypothetical protein
MDADTTGTGRSLARPVHGACVVARCWCRGSVRASPAPDARRGRSAADRPIDLSAWRSVGLPIA